MKLKTAFAYIVYGDSIEYLHEAVYSIATLRQHSPEHPVLILTDHPDRLPSLPFISLVPIDKAMMAEWMEDSKYHFRIKLQGIRHLLENHVEKIIFIDTDTIVRKDLSAWFEKINIQYALMHKYEGRLGASTFSKHYEKVLNRTFRHSDYGEF